MRIADYAVAAAPATLFTVGLGSCVAIVLHDALARVGALAHVLLPAATSADDADRRPARYPGVIVPQMITEMRALGAAGPYTARLVGGASLFGPLFGRDSGGPVGPRNVEAARAALAAARVRLTGELVGGQAGRTVYFDVASGRVDVRSLREGNRVL